MRLRTLGLILALVGAAIAAGRAAAQVEVVAGPITERRAAVATGTLGEARLTLRNGGDAAVTLEGAAHFVHEASGATVAATWRRIADGAPQPSGGFALGPGEVTTLQARATLDRPGLHVIVLEVRAPGTPAHRFELAVDRRIAPLAEAFLLDLPPARIALGAFEAATATPRVVRVVGRNATPDDVIVASVTAGGLVAMDGATAVAAVSAAHPVDVRADCTGTRPARQDCAVDVVLPAGLAPGSYRLDVAALGVGGGQSRQAVAVEVRASPFWAGGLVALGALAGAFVTVWREKGSALIATRIRIADLRSSATRLVGEAADPATRRWARRLVRDLRALDAAAQRGEDAAAPLAGHAARLEALAMLDETYRAARTLPERGAAVVAPRLAALSAALGRTDWEPSAIDTAAEALRAELRAAPGLAAAVDRLAAALTPLTPAVVGVLDADAAFGGAVEAAREALAAALTPLAGPGDTLAARTAALDDAATALEAATRAVRGRARAILAAQLHDLGASMPEQEAQIAALAADLAAAPDPLSLAALDRIAGAMARVRRGGGGGEAAGAPFEGVAVPGIVGPNSALVLDIDPALFGPAGVASASVLARFARRAGCLANLVVLAALGTVGVLVLWVPAPAWGSASDIATALLAGLGTRLAINGAGRPAP